MDANDLKAWMKTHFSLYPMFRDWWHTKVDDKDLVCRHWTDILQSVDLEEANEATRRMMNGIEPVVAFGNWSDLPRFVKAHAHAIRKAITTMRRDSLPVAQRAFDGETHIDPAKMARLVDDFIDVIASCPFEELDSVKKRILDKMQPLDEDKKARPQLTALAAHQLLVLIVKRRTGAKDLPHGLSRVSKKGGLSPLKFGHTIERAIKESDPPTSSGDGILTNMAQPSDEEGDSYDFEV